MITITDLILLQRCVVQSINILLLTIFRREILSLNQFQSGHKILYPYVCVIPFLLTLPTGGYLLLLQFCIGQLCFFLKFPKISPKNINAFDYQLFAMPHPCLNHAPFMPHNAPQCPILSCFFLPAVGKFFLIFCMDFCRAVTIFLTQFLTRRRRIVLPAEAKKCLIRHKGRTEK